MRIDEVIAVYNDRVKQMFGNDLTLSFERSDMIDEITMTVSTTFAADMKVSGMTLHAMSRGAEAMNEIMVDLVSTLLLGMAEMLVKRGEELRNELTGRITEPDANRQVSEG